MSTTPDRVFVARLVGTNVFDPIGDPVGRVRDVVLVIPSQRPASAIGLVVEVPGRRRVFMPLTRVTSIANGQVICTGVVNLRRFTARARETLAMGELLDRHVTLADGSGEAIIHDVGISLTHKRTWNVSHLFVRRAEQRRGPWRIRRRGEGMTLSVDDVESLTPHRDSQGAELLIESFADKKPADIANALMDLSATRTFEVAQALDDAQLADVVEQLPEPDQVTLVNALEPQRAAHVLGEMEPDDAADLLGDLPSTRAQSLLGLMSPEEVRPVQQLLGYADDVAGGLMTTEPIIVSPDTTVATALALVRREQLTPALASVVFVVRPPLETPTGKYLGLVHFQKLLREAPHEPVGSLVDTGIEPLKPDAHLSEVSRTMAAYDLLAAPVLDDAGHLLGVISADDVLDHVLPHDWRTPAESESSRIEEITHG